MTGKQIRILGGTVAWVLLVAPMVTACAEPSETTTSRSPDGTTTTAPPPTTSDATGAPQIVVSPEFINGAIPDSGLVLLVGLVDRDQGPVTITAEAPTAEVAVDPPTVSGTSIAEVTVVPGPAGSETIDVTVTATSGDQTSSVTRAVDIVPWEDDREDQARQILGLFVDWLVDSHPEFGIARETPFSGTLTAPLLMVVSHYGFFSDEWEVGVSWHIMIPPDDFAEMYLRPRTAMQPTHAFRIDSWQTALETGTYAVTEVDPPVEVVR